MAVSVSTLIAPADAAKLLGDISVTTLAAWRVSGEGPRFLKLGSRVFYDRDDLSAWLATRPRHQSTSELETVARRPRAGRRKGASEDTTAPAA